MDAEQKKHVMALATGFMNGSLAKEAFYASLTESIAKAVGCSRASLWQYGSALQDTAVCLDLYDSADQQHHSGAVLREDDFGPYFEAMRRDAMIVAPQACQRRLNIDPPCRSKIDPGRVADFQISNCG